MKIKYRGTCEVKVDVDGEIKPEKVKDVVCQLIFEGRGYANSEKWDGVIDKWTIAIDSMELDLKEADDG